MASTAGGVELKKWRTRIELIFARDHSSGYGIATYHARKLAFGLGLSGRSASAVGPFPQRPLRTFLETDASLAESIR